jgi:signal transduction histidine kinase
LTTHFVEIGAALETIIIAFALGDRYRRLRLEKEEAQLLAFKIQQDATDRLEAKVLERTEELSRANEELHSTLETNKLQTKIIEEKNAELDAFFYRVSHDLKGPIASMLGLSFLAKVEVKDANALAYFDKQHDQVERLNTIIRGLIDITKLNNTDLQMQPINFDKMIDGCIAAFHALPNFSNVTFKKEVQSDIEFYSEWTLVNTILQNLIENAIKYSSEHSPYVFIRVSNNNDGLVIKVEDNGQGIPAEHQSKIFEMFYRATQNANGTGLGLYILKRSVDRLNGSIEIKSEVGIGLPFYIQPGAFSS